MESSEARPVMANRPSIQPEFTQDQMEKRNDQKKGRELWDEALAQYRERKRTLYMPNIESNNGGKPTTASSTSQHNGHFRFLDLTPELRNMVYDYYLEDEKQLRLDRNRTVQPYFPRLDRGQGKWIGSHGTYRQMMEDERPPRYTSKQSSRQHQLQNLTETIIEEVFDQHEDLSDGAQYCLLEYRLQHELHVYRCFHEEHHNPSIVKINERGNLCADLPSLALTNRQMLKEIWGLFFVAKVDKPLKYKGRVRNFDVFPLLRFLCMLRSHDLANVTGNDIQIEFMKMLPRTDELSADEKWYEDEHHSGKFDRVKRLIKMHWLDGLPLWGCSTGLSEDEEDDDPGYDSDDAWYEFAECMYAVRQIVALYRINLVSWRQLSIRFLCELSTGESWEHSSDAEIVSRIIDMVSEGYFGDASKKRQDPAVALCKKYCREVDCMLREELGDGYEEWEKMEDEKTLPMGLLL